MNIDDTQVTAYCDGELDAVERARIERAMALDPVLATRVAAMAALGERVRDAFAPIAQARVPVHLTAILDHKVAAIGPARDRRRWRSGAVSFGAGPAGLALAASLVLGVGVGTVLGSHRAETASAPFVVRGGALVASGALAHALDTQLAATSGDVRTPVSFRSGGGYCRVFAATAVDGIACRHGDGWQIRATRAGSGGSGPTYRQAASADAALMATAQEMMVGMPLDAAGERRARAAGWR